MDIRREAGGVVTFDATITLRAADATAAAAAADAAWNAVRRASLGQVTCNRPTVPLEHKNSTPGNVCVRGPARAKTWCLLTYGILVLATSWEPGKKPGASSHTRKRLSLFRSRWAGRKPGATYTRRRISLSREIGRNPGTSVSTRKRHPL